MEKKRKEGFKRLNYLIQYHTKLDGDITPVGLEPTEMCLEKETFRSVLRTCAVDLRTMRRWLHEVSVDEACYEFRALLRATTPAAGAAEYTLEC